MWVVDIGVPFSDEYNAFKVADKIELAYGDYATSAGSGFGYRDLQFEFDHLVEANRFDHLVRRVLSRHKIEVADNDDHKAYVVTYQERVLP